VTDVWCWWLGADACGLGWLLLAAAGSLDIASLGAYVSPLSKIKMCMKFLSSSHGIDSGLSFFFYS
jgi:hypothetical protein